MDNELLAIQAKAGDTKALHELWEQNTGLLYQLFSAYFPMCPKCRCEPDDLLQCGYFVIMAAVKSFDPGRNLKFTSYLRHHVQNSANDVLGRRGKQKPLEVSGNVPVGEEDGGTELLDIIPDNAAGAAFECVEDDLYTAQLRATLMDCMEKLSEDGRDVIMRRYYKNETLADISEAQGCSIENVRRRERGALGKLGFDRRLREYRADVISHAAWRGGLGRFRDNGASSVELIAEKLEAFYRRLGYDYSFTNRLEAGNERKSEFSTV